MNEHMTRFAPLPDNFIVYNHDRPSPYFPPEKVAYIESINSDFSEEELRAIRSMERFAFNLNTGGVGGDEFAGLRKQEKEDSLYFRRFSDEPWKDVVKSFMARIPPDFEYRRRTLMHLHRATLPNGDRYYPITFRGDLDAWRRHLHQAAVGCGTLLGWFEKGKFVLSDGSKVGFLDLKWDRLLHRQRIPKKW